MGAQLTLRTSVFVFSGSTGVELLGRAVPALTFCGTSILLSVVAAPPHIPARTAHEAPSHRRQLLFSRLLDDDHSDRCAVVSRCGSF